MDLIEVILQNYRFKFRRLFWEEEFALKLEGRDPRRVVLASAMVEVSGLKIKDFDEAWKLVSPETLPTPILIRVFLIYKGKQPENRIFSTHNLYRAPEPLPYERRVEEGQENLEKGVDSVMKRLEEQFSREELAEASEVDKQIMAGSKAVIGGEHRFRGAAKAFDDEDKSPFGAFKAVEKHA